MFSRKFSESEVASEHPGGQPDVGQRPLQRVHHRRRVQESKQKSSTEMFQEKWKIKVNSVIKLLMKCFKEIEINVDSVLCMKCCKKWDISQFSREILFVKCWKKLKIKVTLVINYAWLKKLNGNDPKDEK